MKHDQYGNNFLTGTLLGGILGSAAGLLLAPKSGQELRDDLSDGYCKLTDTARDLSEQIKHPFTYEKNNGSQISPLIAGGLTGVAVGALAALLLAPNSGKKLRQALGEKYEDLIDKTEEIAQRLNKTGHHALENADDLKSTLMSALDKLSKRKGSTMNNVMEWADLGMRLMHQMQKRR